MKIKKIVIGKNLILRPLRKGDEFSLAKNINDKIIAKNTSRTPYPYKLKDGKKWVAKVLKQYKIRKPAQLSLAIDFKGEVVGGIGLSTIEGHQASVGYWLAKPFRGQGITTRALKRITNYGFNQLKLKRIYAKTFLFNPASSRVLEKAGFKFEGVLKKDTKKGKKYLDVNLFAKVK